MPASESIDDEMDRTPAVQGRTAPRTTTKKTSFAAVSKLNIPKDLSIDVDEDGDVDELGANKNSTVIRAKT